MNSVAASIIILTKTAGANFRPLLQRIFSQRFNGDFEVLVVDSGSTDDTVRIAEDFPVRITRIAPEAFHHGRTRNLGAELSCGSTLVYITQDALPIRKNWLQELTGGLRHPSVAMVVGRQVAWQTTKPPEKSFYVQNFPEHRIVVNYSHSGYYLDNIFISNVNSAIRKDVWQQFRFSEAVITAEDKEFANRILAAGWTIVHEPAAAVYHAHDLSIRSAFHRSVDSGIALRQGVGGPPRAPKSLIGRVFRQIRAELRYYDASGYLKWVPYSMIYHSSKYLGLLIGRSGLVKRNRVRA